MIVTLILLFFIGYLCIALEHPLRIDKTAIALLLGMIMWIVYALGAEWLVPLVDSEALARYIADNPRLAGSEFAHQCLEFVLNVKIVESLGDISQTLFFLIGAMTIVELIDVHGGFTVITDHISTRDKRRLLYVICFTTFVFSAVLDNMTTTIVMILLLRKLVSDKMERWLYAGMIIIAANTGGAWSPIGDVTTIMLWVKGNVTAPALICYVLLPSLAAMIVPMLSISKSLKGKLPPMAQESKAVSEISSRERKTIFYLGVGGLIFVPVFKTITHMPPFVGILLVLALLWVFTEVFYNGKMLDRSREHRLPKVISRIDMPSILFFLGILMAVSVLDASGILRAAAGMLDEHVHNVYLIDLLLGVLSSIFDNVPLVAGVMGMYPIAMPDATGYAANFVVDGTFWEFLIYCAGVGCSLLIIGSA
ncbi:MAG: sodium:proton antiporter NhaD, partial [Muribaculaceae bacterium]|nr:sodium:proton antiporter NhaD [Muribaculaceae bacterium]